MGQLTILSRSGRPFTDRLEAGQLLAQALQEYRGSRTVVLGIPRGGVVIASVVARALGAEVDIVLARKLGAPGNPEFAIGAIAEDQKLFLDEPLLAQLNVTSEYLTEEKARQLAELKRRIGLYRPVRPKMPLHGRVVIVTDDGVATGATMQAALWTVRQEAPTRLIAALPVGPGDTVKRLAAFTDELLCLRAPAFFGAIGQFYKQFEQVEDDEVLAILKRAEETEVP
jgi:putative phosphoribosyl transferase